MTTTDPELEVIGAIERLFKTVDAKTRTRVARYAADLNGYLNVTEVERGKLQAFEVAGAALQKLEPVHALRVLRAIGEVLGIRLHETIGVPAPVFVPRPMRYTPSPTIRRTRARYCGYCGGAGHTRRSCTRLWRDERAKEAAALRREAP